MRSSTLIVAASAVTTVVYASTSSSSSSSSRSSNQSHYERSASIYFLNPPDTVPFASSVHTYSAPDAHAVVSSYLSIEEWERLRDGLVIPEQITFTRPDQDHGNKDGPSTAQPLLILADKLSKEGELSDYLSLSTLNHFNTIRLDVTKSPKVDAWRGLLSKYVERLQEKFGCFGDVEDSIEDSQHLDSRMLIPGSLDFNYAYGEAIGQDEVYAKYLASLSSLAAYDATGFMQAKSGFIHLTGLGEIKNKFGTDSDEFRKAKEMLKLTLDSVISAKADRKIVLFLVSSPDESLLSSDIAKKSHKARRAYSISPLDAFSTHPRSLSSRQGQTQVMPLLATSGYCYPDASTCGNSTSSCSAHGACVQAIKAGYSSLTQPAQCWVCQCTVTQDQSGRNRYWNGNMCQKEDVSSQFFLLAGSTFLLLFVGISSISLLAKVGSEHLPSTLAALGGGPGGHHKRD